MKLAQQLTILKPIINVNMCFLGIEFCWALLMPNISSIFLFLGAMPSTLAYLWLAPPLIGLIIQPIIGQLSDNTVSRYGKRKPYIFVGLILTCILCILLPFAKSLWLGAAVLWLLIAVVNVAHQPMRGLAVDVIPHDHLTLGFAMQMGLMGLGSIIGIAMPYLFNKFPPINIPGAYQPSMLTLAFFMAGVIALITGLWTCMSVKEHYNPADMMNRKKSSIFGIFKEIFVHIFDMPKILKQISIVQFLLWVAFFVLFAYFNLGIAQKMFGLPPGADIDHNVQYKALMAKATVYTSLCFIFFQLSSFLVSLVLPIIVRFIHRKTWLTFTLVLGGIGLLSTFISPAYYIFAAITMGIAWGSSLITHFTMLATNLPKGKMGLYMGLFNIANTVSQIVTGILLGPIIRYVFHDQVFTVVALSGVFLFLAAIFNQRIEDKGK